MYKFQDCDAVCGGYRSFRDIAIQEQLTEADDEFVAKELLNKEIQASRLQKNGFLNCNTGSGNFIVNDINGRRNITGNLQKCREFRNFQLCGWQSDPNVVYRKTENGRISKSKFAAGSLGKDPSLARDSKSKTFSSEDFVFQHYLETNKYIEQYRRQHRCSSNITLSSAKSDLSDLRKPHQNHNFLPMTIFSQNLFKQEASLPLSQLNDLSTQTSNKQNQTQNKSSQMTTAQLANKQELQRQKFQLLKNSQKQYSPPIDTYDISRVVGISESAPSSSHTKRICSTKELMLIPAVTDTPVLKPTADMIKVQTFNIESLPNKHASLPKPGPLQEAVTGSPLLVHKVGFGVTNQMRMFDTAAFRLGSGNDKQSSGSQEVPTCSDAYLGPVTLAYKQEHNPKSAQLFMTSPYQEGHLQTQGPDFHEKLQILQAPNTKSNRNDRVRNGIDMVTLANSFHLKEEGQNSQVVGKIAKRNLPYKENSLLTVVGHDCSKTRKFVCNHLAIARKHNDKVLLSHNKKIQNLIDESKVKRKFDQILNISKAPVKTVLEIKSIQITDPFVKAVPGNGQRSDSNNSCKARQYVSSDVCFCVVNYNNNYNMRNYSRKGVPLHEKICENCNEVSAQDRDEGCKNTRSYSESSQSNVYDSFAPINLATSAAGLDLSLQSTHSGLLFTDNCDVKTQVGQGFYAACVHAVDVCLPKSLQGQACLNESYYHQLAEKVQKMG